MVGCLCCLPVCLLSPRLIVLSGLERRRPDASLSIELMVDCSRGGSRLCWAHRGRRVWSWCNYKQQAHSSTQMNAHAIPYPSTILLELCFLCLRQWREVPFRRPLHESGVAVERRARPNLSRSLFVWFCSGTCFLHTAPGSIRHGMAIARDVSCVPAPINYSQVQEIEEPDGVGALFENAQHTRMFSCRALFQA